MTFFGNTIRAMQSVPPAAVEPAPETFVRVAIARYKDTPSGLAHAIACAIVRTFGADKASTFADAVVGAVQVEIRKARGMK